MLILTATDQSITLVTGAAVSTDYIVSWADNTASTFTPGSGQGNITTATTTAVMAAPGASTQRAVKGIMITNRHASSSQTVQLFKLVGASSYAISQNLTLLAGQTAVYNENGLSILTNSQLFVASGKLLQAQNSLNLIGTDSTTQTFPTTNAVIARTDAAQTFTGVQTYSNRVLVDDVTDASTTTDGSLQTDGGLSVAKNGYFGGALTVTSTGSVFYHAGSDSTIANFRGDSGVAIKFQPSYAAGTAYNWRVEAQYSTGASFVILPSTAAGGDTFTTKALQIHATTFLVTIAGGLTASGAISTSQTSTLTTGSKYSLEGIITANPASSSSAVFRGGMFQTLTSADCAQNISADLVGVFSECSHYGTGTTISGVVGLRALALNRSNTSTVSFVCGLYSSSWGSSVAGGTTTNAYGAYISAPTVTGTITNAYGLYVGAVAGAGTLNYGIYSAGGVSKFMDNTASSSTTTGALVIVGGLGVGGTVSATLFRGNHIAYGSNESNIAYECTGGVSYINYRGATDAITIHYLCDGKGAGVRSSLSALRVLTTGAQASTTTVTGDIVAAGGIATGDYFTGKHRSSDGTAGTTLTRTFYTASSSGGTVNVLNTVTIKDGLIVGWTQA